MRTHAPPILITDDCQVYRRSSRESGGSKYWCATHNAPATAKYGGRLPRCEGAYRTISEEKRFKLKPGDFSGGIALWGAVDPVYNSTRMRPDAGVHVHARTVTGGKKDLDRSYEAVEVSVKENLFEERSVLITKETAVAYYISRFLNRKIESLFCPYCSEPHLGREPIKAIR